MFEVGFAELFVLGVIALLVVGPDRLPGLARTVGVWVGRAQRMVGQVRADIEREVRADELRKAAKEYSPTNVLSDMHKDVEDFASEISQPLDVDATKGEAEKPESKTTSSKTTSSATAENKTATSDTAEGKTAASETTAGAPPEAGSAGATAGSTAGANADETADSGKPDGDEPATPATGNGLEAGSAQADPTSVAAPSDTARGQAPEPTSPDPGAPGDGAPEPDAPTAAEPWGAEPAAANADTLAGGEPPAATEAEADPAPIEAALSNGRTADPLPPAATENTEARQAERDERSPTP